MDKMKLFRMGLVFCCLWCAGCAAASSGVKPSEPVREQIDAARKVVGAMAPAQGVVEKYSPATGRHYSGALEYEPGTGVKLIPVEE
jgi:hypothetical protein